MQLNTKWLVQTLRKYKVVIEMGKIIFQTRVCTPTGNPPSGSGRFDADSQRNMADEVEQVGVVTSNFTIFKYLMKRLFTTVE